MLVSVVPSLFPSQKLAELEQPSPLDFLPSPQPQSSGRREGSVPSPPAGPAFQPRSVGSSPPGLLPGRPGFRLSAPPG